MGFIEWGANEDLEAKGAAVGRNLDLRLNEGAAAIVEDLCEDARLHGLELHRTGGAMIADCGVVARGSLSAGLALAEICMGSLGEVSYRMGRVGGWPCPYVTVSAADPLSACLFSQYAGWKIAVEDYFAMGSGPMRAVLAKEPLFKQFGYSESVGLSVGVLEASKLPTKAVVERLLADLGVEPAELVLLVARTASMAGTCQIVARSLETCLHKLHELGFDVESIRSGMGAAPLPPVPRDDLVAIGRTNDAILYGGEVFLWYEGEDSAALEFGPKTPASASPEYGEPFAEIFRRSGGDFYKIDPMLFSPAEVVLNNLSTGSCFRFGRTAPEIVERSFFGSAS